MSTIALVIPASVDPSALESWFDAAPHPGPAVTEVLTADRSSGNSTSASLRVRIYPVTNGPRIGKPLLSSVAESGVADWLCFADALPLPDRASLVRRVGELESSGADIGSMGRSAPLFSAAGVTSWADLAGHLAAATVAPGAGLLIRRGLLKQLLAARTADSPEARLRVGAALGCALQGPEYVQIGPSDTCSARCQFCRFHSPLFARPAPHRGRAAPPHPAQLDFAIWSDCIEDLICLGTSRIDYVGIGEPLLHPRIDDALRLGRGRIGQTMITNGLHLASHVAPLAESLDQITISMNAARAETHARLMGCHSEAFARVTRGVEDLRRASARTGITLSFVVNRLNYEELPAFADLSRRLGTRAMLTPLGVYPETEAELGLTADDRTKLFRLLDLLERQHDQPITNLATYRSFFDRDTSPLVTNIPCYVGQVFAQIRGDGSVAFCCAGDTIVGNVNARRFPDIWFSSAYNRARHRALTYTTRTGRAVPGCNCFICGFAYESLRVFNTLHGTRHTLESLKRATAPMHTVGVEREVAGA